MKGYIDNYNFYEMEAMKYFSPKAGDPKAKDDAYTKVMSGKWLGARKMDGFFCKAIKDEDGNVFLLSRSKGVSGEYADKYELVPHLHDFFEAVSNGTCILGELYFPTHEGSSEVTKVLGCLPDKAIKRQENDKINFYVFDMLAEDGNSYMAYGAAERFKMLEVWSKRFDYEYVQFARYKRGQELWTLIQDTLNAGGEGAVITNENALYSPGSRSKKATLKIKKEVQDTIDVFVIDKLPATRLSNTTTPQTWLYWENVKTMEKVNKNMYREYALGRGDWEPITKGYYYDWPGSFVFGANKNGKVISVCSISGLTEEVLSHYSDYKGKVAEISAMEVLPTGGLRHPKLIHWRDDKTPKDCKWEDIFGE